MVSEGASKTIITSGLTLLLAARQGASTGQLKVSGSWSIFADGGGEPSQSD